MKDLPIFNKGDKVTVNNKYIGLESMVGEIYTIRAGPARCSDTWCYWLENVAGGIAADALEPLEQTNEEWLHTLNTEQLAGFLADKCNEVVETVLSDASCDIGDIDNDDYWYRQADFVEWLKEKHHE